VFQVIDDPAEVARLEALHPGALILHRVQSLRCRGRLIKYPRKSAGQQRA
jgi:hypothetical protein